MSSALAPQLQSLLGPDERADKTFDSAYPDWVRCRSERHWTPVEVAQRAAELLVTSARTRVLDVGAGAGKFCIIGALTTQGRFYGIEHQMHLVDVARETADHYGVQQRVQFTHGNMISTDWREFNAFYFYNPFCEHMTGLFGATDQTVDFAPRLRESYIRFARAQLTASPVGTRVVTYHGYGGRFPPGYRCVTREGRGTDFVELWVKEPTPLWMPPFDVEDLETRSRLPGDERVARGSGEQLRSTKDCAFAPSA
jgi:hypothetical protein